MRYLVSGTGRDLPTRDLATIQLCSSLFISFHPFSYFHLFLLAGSLPFDVLPLLNQELGLRNKYKMRLLTD